MIAAVTMTFFAMKSKFYRAVLVSVAGLLLPAITVAQSDSGEAPPGDVARALRKKPDMPAHTVIDNDNFNQVMDEVESRRLNAATLAFSGDDARKALKVFSPDGTCSLSFSAQAEPLLSEQFLSQELPDSEVSKLDGPASLSGDTLQVSVYNGTAWNLREITVGLTLLRKQTATTADYGVAKLLPAVAGDPPSSLPGDSGEKRSDVTVLIHLKGAAAPLASAVFRQPLGAALSPDQEWHWAILKAKGIPPQALPSSPTGPSGQPASSSTPASTSGPASSLAPQGQF